MIGHGQVDTMSRSGQHRSNFKVGISEKNGGYDSVFYSELIGTTFVPVGGLQPPHKWIQEIGVCYSNSFLEYLGIKYHGSSFKIWYVRSPDQFLQHIFRFFRNFKIFRILY